MTALTGPATIGCRKEFSMGTAIGTSHGGSTWRRKLDEPQVRVALVTAVCLLVEAIIAKNVIDVELDAISQLAPLWVFIAFLLSGLRDRTSEIAFMIAIVVVTAAVLVLYAV
jgi:hypothetical protein